MSRKEELVLLGKCGATLEVRFPFCDMQRRHSTETPAGEVPLKFVYLNLGDLPPCLWNGISDVRVVD